MDTVGGNAHAPTAGFKRVRVDELLSDSIEFDSEDVTSPDALSLVNKILCETNLHARTSFNFNSCLFAAIADQLQGLGQNITYPAVRKIITKWLLWNSDYRSLDYQCTLQSLIKEQDWKNYCITMESEDTWRDCVVLAAAAECFKVMIVIWFPLLYSGKNVSVLAPCNMDRCNFFRMHKSKILLFYWI